VDLLKEREHDSAANSRWVTATSIPTKDRLFLSIAK